MISLNKIGGQSVQNDGIHKWTNIKIQESIITQE